MLRISNIKISVTEDEKNLPETVRKKYGIRELKSFKIVKRSIDARKKNAVVYTYSVDVETENDKKYIGKNISEITYKKYEFPICKNPKKHILVVGMGPAGLMCALMLAKSGVSVTVIERGKCVEERKADTEKFFRECILDENSNVQFGEGGAGTFSDGKLTTGINDIRIQTVLEEFCAHGAPEEILYNAKPHIGTDNLYHMVRNIRKSITENGGEVKFSHTLTDIIIEKGTVVGAAVSHGGEEKIIKADAVVLATGHSARDTFEMLKKRNVPMERKAFSVGVRIEHRQSVINESQYGEFAKYLGAADYKLSVHLPSGRGVYTFCMCPGGEVIASASEKNSVVTNGMSRYARDGENANSAVLVNITPSDFDGDDVLAGMYFQRELEKKAFVAGGENYNAPAQTVGDFLEKSSESEVTPTYRPGVTFTKLDTVLPSFVTESIKEALPEFDKKIKGFADGGAVMTAPETRSSSPVRVIRDAQSLQSEMKGLYPCGEGAGYAGGITSAAVDGIKVAEKIVFDICGENK